MSIRVFVPSAGLLIFSWLAVTYLTVVPMDTYPGEPGMVASPKAKRALADTTGTVAEGADQRRPERVLAATD